MCYKRIWTQEEDNFLRNHVQFDVKKNWIHIAEIFNQTFQGVLRSAKQCRERFINHVNINMNQPFTKEWNDQSLNILFMLYEQYGHKWTLIAKLMQDKSENVVKNKFYCGMRKFIRKLNRFLKNHSRKSKKQIKYQSIMRILDANECFIDLPQQIKSWNSLIRLKILELTLKSIREEDFTEKEIDELTENINGFNLQTRSYKTKKIKNCQAEKSKQTSSVGLGLNIDYEEAVLNDYPPKLKINGTEVSQILVSSIIRSQTSQRQKVEELSVENTHRLSAEYIFQNFGVTLNRQHLGQSNKLNMDILDEMFPETITPLNFDQLI